MQASHGTATAGTQQSLPGTEHVLAELGSIYPTVAYWASEDAAEEEELPAIDLEEQGFESFVVADAVGSRSKASRKLALTRLLKSGADVVDSEMVLFEWLERAGTREFKELHALVK